MNLLMIGGTGTLGQAVAPLLSSYNVTILSRGEYKQKKMMSQYPHFGYHIGDVRDLRSFPRGHFDVVFHFAALKHIDVCEDNISECIKTNVLGTENVRDFCLENKVRCCVLSSTDKAVLPINVYGYSKALSEKMFFDANMNPTPCRFSVFRWGNVIGSRGSVVPMFKESLLKEGTIKLTHKDMTRFWITFDSAAQFILDNYLDGFTSKAMIPDMKAAKVSDVAEAIAQVLGVSDYDTEIIGIRPGEKIHECLRSEHDSCFRSDTCDQYSMDELKTLVGPYL